MIVVYNRRGYRGYSGVAGAFLWVFRSGPNVGGATTEEGIHPWLDRRRRAAAALQFLMSQIVEPLPG